MLFDENTFGVNENVSGSEETMSKLKFGGNVILFMALCMLLLGPFELLATETENQGLAPGRRMAQQATKTKELWITADHSKHKALQQEFKSGPEVSQACLSCHSEAAAQFQKTIHWTWLDPATAESKVLGKGGFSINNF
jgi:uncharacterized paraquat-inducible protein A